MTAKQILDTFSETLMQDERILSPRERELLMSLLQNSRSVSSGDPETQSAVTATIARAVGETVAQRAFTLLGGSMVDQILAGSRPGAPAYQLRQKCRRPRFLRSRCSHQVRGVLEHVIRDDHLPYQFLHLHDPLG